MVIQELKIISYQLSTKVFISLTLKLLPCHGSQWVQNMAGAEPLNEEGSPPYTEKPQGARGGG